MPKTTYKIRKFQNGRNRKGEPFINYSLTIPSVVAEALPSGLEYNCELTDVGILFRPVDKEAEKPVLPGWAKDAEANGAGAKKPSRARSRVSDARPVGKKK